MKILSQSGAIPSKRFLFFSPEGVAELQQKNYETLQGSLEKKDAHEALSSVQNDIIGKTLNRIEKNIQKKELSPEEEKTFRDILKGIIDTNLEGFFENKDIKSQTGIQVSDFLNKIETTAGQTLDQLDSTINLIIEEYKNSVNSPENWNTQTLLTLQNIQKEHESYSPGDWWKINGEIANALGITVPEEERGYFGKAFQEIIGGNDIDGMIGTKTLALLNTGTLTPLLAKAKETRSQATPNLTEMTKRKGDVNILADTKPQLPQKNEITSNPIPKMKNQNPPEESKNELVDKNEKTPKTILDEKLKELQTEYDEAYQKNPQSKEDMRRGFSILKDTFPQLQRVENIKIKGMKAEQWKKDSVKAEKYYDKANKKLNAFLESKAFKKIDKNELFKWS